MKKTKRGFTLIEVMTTIAILGILTGVTVVSAQSFREASRAKTASSLSNAIIASLTECIDNNGIPVFSFAATAICDDTTVTPITWPDLSETGWEWFSGSSNWANRSFEFDVNDPSDSTGCITCTNFGCQVDKTADCVL